MRTSTKGILAGIGLLLASSTSVLATELTIFWAEWDPANYLQQLVNEYTKETGVKITVETTPWSDFQTKTFAEFNAHGDAYDMVVGDSQWLGAGATAGHYVELTDFFKDNNVAKLMAPATVKYYAEYPGNSGKYWAIPLEGDAVGWAYRKDWFADPKEQAAFKAKYGYDLAVPKDQKALRDIAEFFYRPAEKRYGVAVYTDNSYDAMAMGFENSLFSNGGDWGDYGTFDVEGHVNGPKAVEALNNYRDLYKFAPPGWAKTFYVEDNQAITEGLAAMSMNFFAFLPSLLNEQTNPHAKDTGFFANPPGAYGDQFAALGGQGISIVSYSQKQEESFKFLKWFISDKVQQEWADLGGYTCSAAVLSSDAFRKKTPYNEAFYQTMFTVKDFWAVPEYADLLSQLNTRVYPYIISGEGGTAQDVLNGLAADWKATLSSNGHGTGK